jgi:Ca2+-binding RTX toxin-like protein
MENQTMTTIIVGPQYSTQMDGPNPFSASSPVDVETSTYIELQPYLDTTAVLQVYGSFTYSANGAVTGTVTGANYTYNNLTATGNIDAHTFFSNLIYDPLISTFWASILHGGDTIEGGNGQFSGGRPNHLYGFGNGGDEIIGGSNGDWLIGFGGNNTIVGGADTGSALIDAGPGFNQLWGGYLGGNIFICSVRSGRFWDVINNFIPRYNWVTGSDDHDVVDLMGLPGLHNFHQVVRHEFLYHGSVAIHDNIGDVVVFANIHHKAQLHPYDFHFFA